MSDAAITPVAGGKFTPRTLVAIRVSSYTMNLYPVVDETMEVHERAHVYGVVHAWVGQKHLNCYIFKCF